MGATGALYLQAFSGATQAYSQYQAGRAEQRLANFNARQAELQAQDAITRGREAQQRLRQQVKQVRGTQRARFAGQNVVVGRGSSAQVDAETQVIGELDALTIRNNAAREALGYRTEAIDRRLRGKFARIEGQQRAIGTLLTTGADVARTRYEYKQAGIL